MKKSNHILRITAISLAFLMFFTSAGFSMDMHFCQGELKTVSLFGKAKSCHEIGEGAKDCPYHQNLQSGTEEKDTVKKKNCCENQLEYFHLDQDQQNSSDHFTLNTSLQHFLIAYVSTFLSATLVERKVVAFALYKPPTIPRDIPVLFESFLL